jgi:mannosyltransferase
MIRYLPLLLILVAAVVVRWPPLHEDLWLDELHSSWTVSGEWSDVVDRARFGNQSPLYFALLKCCRYLSPKNEWSLRLPSFLAGLTTVSLLYVWTLKAALKPSPPAPRPPTPQSTFETAAESGRFVSLLLGCMVATMVATIAALDPKFVFFHTEARPYAIVQLLALLTVAAFLTCLSKPTPTARITWAFGSIVLCYLHYTAVVIPAATLGAVIAAKFTSHGSAYRWRCYTRDLLVVALTTIPLWRHMSEIASRRKQWEQFVPPSTDWNWVGKLDLDYLLFVPLVAWAIARAIGMLGLDRSPSTAASSTDRKDADFYSSLLNVWPFAVLPVITILLVSVSGVAPVLLYRYLVVVPPLMLLSWSGLTCRLGPRGRILFVIVLVAYLPYGSGYWTRWQKLKPLISPRGEAWSEAAGLVQRDREPIFFRSGYIEANAIAGLATVDRGSLSETERELIEYCMGPLDAIYDFGLDDRTHWPLPNELPQYDANRVAPLVEGHRAAWVILRIPSKRYGESIDWANDLIAARGGGRILSKRWYGRVLVLRLSFTGPNEIL